jgi:hypothetical protein
MEEVVAELHIPNLDIEHTELDVIHGSIRWFISNNRKIKDIPGAKKGLKNMCLLKIIHEWDILVTRQLIHIIIIMMKLTIFGDETNSMIGSLYSNGKELKKKKNL